MLDKSKFFRYNEIKDIKRQDVVINFFGILVKHSFIIRNKNEKTEQRERGAVFKPDF